MKRSDMASYTSYGYCASHSRFSWGLALHVIATPLRFPVACALTSAKTDERDTALALIGLDTTLDDRPGRVLMADKSYRSSVFETELKTRTGSCTCGSSARGITLIRPTVRSETTKRPHREPPWL